MKYLNGYSLDDNIKLVYLKDSKKKIKTIKSDWYFLISKFDYQKNRKLFDDISDKRVSVYPYGHAKLFNKVEIIGNYVRIYCDRFIVQNPRVFRKGEQGINIYNKSAYYKNADNVLRLLDILEDYEIVHYDADLTPLQRYIIDNDVEIESDYRKCYFDIEACHPRVDFSDHANWQVYSIAWKGNDGKKGFLIADGISDTGEKKLLHQFLKVMDNYDSFYAWNGDNFDFPVIWERCKYHDINVEWQYCLFVDLMRLVKKYYEETEARISFSLDNISYVLLGERKQKIDSSIYDLFYKDKKMLRKYNEKDTDLLYRIDEKTGFSDLDIAICRIGNCFIHDPYVQTKVDGYLLKKAASQEIYFKTNKRSADGEASYAGGYVADPVVGIHNGIALFDFKALYPSMMMDYNISPEKLVLKEDVKKCKKELIITPTGSYFIKEGMGIFGQSFKDTTDKRKKYQEKIKEVRVNSKKYKLYTNLANAYKIFGLSFYGALGQSYSRYYNLELAYAVTGSGQWWMKEIRRYIEKLGYETVYGDTDSLFVDIKENKCEQIVRKVAKHIKKKLPEFNCDTSNIAIELEYESYFKRIIFITKKRYAGIYKIYKGTKSDEIVVKGLEYKRSDGISYSRNVQKKVIEWMLKEDKSVKSYEKYILKIRDKVISGGLSKDQLIITQSISKSLNTYKNIPVHVIVAKWMSENGYDIYNGCKIPYIVINSKPKLNAVHSDKYSNEYDGIYYWSNKVYPPILRILNIVFPDNDWDKHLIKKPNKEIKRGTLLDGITY